MHIELRINTLDKYGIPRACYNYTGYKALRVFFSAIKLQSLSVGD